MRLGLKGSQNMALDQDSEQVAYVNAERDGFPLCGNLRAGRVFWFRLITLFERQETCTKLD